MAFQIDDRVKVEKADALGGDSTADFGAGVKTTGNALQCYLIKAEAKCLYENAPADVLVDTSTYEDCADGANCDADDTGDKGGWLGGWDIYLKQEVFIKRNLTFMI